jgi:transcriptional regulator with XRE-family HTH domain
MTDFETNGLQIVDRINDICRKKGIKKKDVSEALKLPDNCFSNWSARGTIPAGDICLKIAEYLNVSIEWLICGKEGGLNNEERWLLSQWKNLDAVQKDTVRTLLNKWESDRTAFEKQDLKA